jgi:glycosyltransferase involved in cell wall biosynthesis
LKDKVLEFPFDYAIVISKWLENEVLSNHKIKYPLERVGWRPYFYNHDLWPVREKFNGKLTITTLQHFNEQKRFNKALDAFDVIYKKYKDKVNFVTFGYNKKNSRSYVQHIENPNDTELNGIYNDTDIFIVPSIKEGVGYTGMEAGICKCAVVMADDNGGGEDYIINGVTGILKPVNKLHEGIIELIEHPSKGKKYGEDLHNYIINNFKDDDYLSKVENVIIKVINS